MKKEDQNNDIKMNKQKQRNQDNNNENLNKENIIDKEPEIVFLDDFSRYDLSFKIIIIGDCGVGKTCLTKQSIKSEFIEGYQATIGLEYYTMFFHHDKKIIKLQIWDTCGMEVYRSLIQSFYVNSSLAIIVYAINDESSFGDVDFWIKELKSMSSPDIKIILIGNKIDLEDQRKISKEQGEHMAKDYGFVGFFETSAKTGENVRVLFKKVIKILYKDYLYYGDVSLIPNTKNSPSLSLNKRANKKPKSNCC